MKDTSDIIMEIIQDAREQGLVTAADSSGSQETDVIARLIIAVEEEQR